MRSLFFFISILTLFALGATGSETKCLIEPPYRAIKAISVLAQSKAQVELIVRILIRFCEFEVLGDSDRIVIDVPTVLFITNEQYEALVYERDNPTNADVQLPPFDLLSVNVEDSINEGPQQHFGYARNVGRDGASLIDALGSNPPLDQEFYKQYWSYPDLLYKWSNLTYLYFPYVGYEIVGQSIAGRDLFVLKIGRTSEENPKRVFLRCHQHAREWVTSPACTYVLEYLAVAFGNHEGELAAMLLEVEVLVAPMLNPDGYDTSRYPHNRFHRKNVRTVKCKINKTHIGVDLNRNWGIDFGGKESTSTDPCSDVYIGKSAFSEPETEAIRRFVKRTPGIVAHADIHSFSALVLGAWLHTDRNAPKEKLSARVGTAIEKAMRSVDDEKYRFGKAQDLLYLASGTCSDWFTGEGILSYTFELRPYAKIAFFDGFELPEKQILLAGKETLAGVEVLIKYAHSPRDLKPGF